MTREEIIDREGRFVVGYDDGVRDRRAETGRPLGEENADYAAGYVAGKYKQVLFREVESLNEALDIQISEIWIKQA